MTPKTIGYAAGALLLSAIIGYGIGRYALPAKIVTVTKTETKTEIQWKDRIVEKMVQGPVRTVVHTVTRDVACAPGETAPVTTTDTVIDASPVIIDRVGDSTGTATAATKSETTKTVTNEQPRLMLQAGASLVIGIPLKPEWSAGASYRLAGPFWLGAAYQSSQRLEIRASLTF